MSEKKYLVIDQQCDGDCWEYVFDTPEEANREAANQWFYMTDRARKSYLTDNWEDIRKGRKSHLFAAIVLREWLRDDAIDEETGEIDWRQYEQCDLFPGAFDSDGARPLLSAAERWESEEGEDEYRRCSPDRLYFDLETGRWGITANLNDDPIDLVLSADGRTVEIAE